MITDDTFLKLIENYRVEIPLLQRDYAQGRSKTEDKKAPAVRERFVKELFKALEADGNPLELDFIYGPNRNDADGIDVFIPLDGQQRLTTLFLLHWYIAKREGQGWYATKPANQEDSGYKEFTYKVRTTTQEFLNALLNKDLELDLPPKETITDAAWYYSAWDLDPSVQGMLNMLDAIHAEYSEKQAPLWNRLGNITFQLLNMGEYRLSDDLYMKMNARGVALTDFENFKSWFTDKCPAGLGDNAYFYAGNDLEKQEQSWNWKIDKEWADFFWSIRDSKADEIDAAFLRFFKAVALNAYASVFVGDISADGAAEYRENISRLNKDEEYVPVAEYDETFGLTKDETLFAVFSVLDHLASAGKAVLTDALKEILFFTGVKEEPPLIGLLPKRMFTYSEQVLFYGMFLFFGQNNTGVSDKKFFDWMRVVRNLVVNSQIDSPQTFVLAVKGLKKLYDAAKGGILDYLAGTSVPVIDGFRETQVNEEIQKAKLLCSAQADAWRESFMEYENHPLFEGQVGFLLRESATDFSNWLSVGDLAVFQSRAANAKKLWDEKGSVFDREEHNHLLFRALIAGGYLNLSDREIDLTNSKASWKNLLRSDVLPPAILGLLDCCFVQGKEVLDSLQEMIKTSNPEHNLARYITGNEKGVHYSPWLYAKCYKNLDDGVLQLRKSKGAWSQNRYYLSQKRDQLLNEVFDILKDDGAVFVDWDSGESTNRKPDLFFKEWLTVGLVLEHKGGSAYVAYTTDGLAHEIGVRKDRKASSEKFDQITELVNLCIGSGFEGVNWAPEENWWWYAYGQIEKPEAEKIARRLKALRDKLAVPE